MIWSYVLRRVLHAIPILFGITLVTFVLFSMVGGDPAAQVAGRYATTEQIEILRVSMGLNKPLLEQYFDYVQKLIRLDLGTSWASNQPVKTLLQQGLGPSLSITGPAFLLSLALTLTLAMIATRWRNTWVDRWILVASLSFTSISAAVYVMAAQYWFAFQWDWFPISGWDPTWTGRWSYASLPILILAALHLGNDTLFFRTVLLSEQDKEYVRTARAKGLSEADILKKHILKNSLVPIFTLVILQIPFLILGSLLTEAYFSIPGLGGLIFHSIQNADLPVIKVLTAMTGIVYVIFQILTDVLCAWADPKIRLNL